MQPGEIYSIYFRFKPPGQGGKYRPALILTTDSGQAIAVAVKITKSGPKPYFPHRIPIRNWRRAGLHKPSYVEYDTAATLNTQSNYKYIGTIHPMDFNNVLKAFRSYYGV